MKDKLTYLKKVYCTNCNEYYTLRFEYGEVAIQKECPICGVSEEQIRRSKMREEFNY